MAAQKAQIVRQTLDPRFWITIAASAEYSFIETISAGCKLI